MLLTLLKIRLSSAYSSLFKSVLDRKKKRGPIIKILIGVLVVYSFAAFILLFGMSFYLPCQEFCGSGLDWLYLALVSLTAFLVSFIVGIFTAQSELFDAKDNDLLLSMPIKPKTILASRIGVMMLYDFLFEIMILIPAWTLYCIFGKVTFTGAICFFIGMLTVPFLSEAFSCLFGWLIASITLRMKHRNLLTVFFSIIFILLFILGYMKLSLAFSGKTTWLADNGIVIAGFIRRFALPFWCLGIASTGESPLLLLVFLAFVGVCFIAVYFVLSESFIRIATTKQSLSKNEYHERTMKVLSVQNALIRKELGRFLSSSNYILNSSLGLVFMLILGIAAVIKGSALLEIMYADASMAGLIKYLGAWAILSVCLMLSITFITAPSVSLEGSTLWISQSVPVGGNKILNAKFACHMIICMPFIIVTALLINIALPITILMRVFLFLTPISYCAFIAYSGLIVGTKYARFDWVDEILVIKQGVAVFLAMLIGFGSLIICGGLCFVLSAVIPIDISVIVVTLLLSGVSFGMNRYISNHGSAQFAGLN